jgi:hypothetical protein
MTLPARTDYVAYDFSSPENRSLSSSRAFIETAIRIVRFVAIVLVVGGAQQVWHTHSI